MKRITYPVFFLLTLGLLTLVAGCTSETSALNVNDVASDPAAYSGTLNVVGVVNAFSKEDPSIVGIMDKKELQCTSPNCNKVLLPVKVNGKPPVMGDEIVVKGSFESQPAFGLVLVAQSMEILANHTLEASK